MKGDPVLYDAWQKALRDNPNPKQYVGTAATAKGIIPWTQANVRHGRIVHNPERVTVDFGLEPIRKRTPNARLEDVTGRIYKEALKSYKERGRVFFPRSVLRDIQQEAWRSGEPISLSQIESLAESEIRPLCERYAQALLQRCERKFEANNKHLPLAVKGA